MISTESILRFLAPHECLGCHREGGILCSACLDALPPVMLTSCLWCTQRIESASICVQCAARSAISSISIRTSYTGVARDMVYATKFARVREGASGMAKSLAAILPLSDGPYIVTYVPTAPTRRRQRGYDQAELIAQNIARQHGWRCRPLLRRRDQARQLGASRQRRQEQARRSFEVISGTPPAVTRLLLIDDVITTGASVEMCASLLAQAGYQDITVAVFAHTPSAHTTDLQQPLS